MPMIDVARRPFEIPSQVGKLWRNSSISSDSCKRVTQTISSSLFDGFALHISGSRFCEIDFVEATVENSRRVPSSLQLHTTYHHVYRNCYTNNYLDCSTYEGLESEPSSSPIARGSLIFHHLLSPSVGLTFTRMYRMMSLKSSLNQASLLS